MKLFRTASIQGKQRLILVLTSGVALLLTCVTLAAYEAVRSRHTLTFDLTRLADLGVFCVASLVAVALSARLQRKVSGPILDLVQTARQVGQRKDFSVRAAKQTEDELGTLVDGFNEMLNQIQQRDAELQGAKDSLERRVEERTAELQQRTEELHREVLQHRSTEEALAGSERLMVSLVETLPQHVLRKDLEGKFTFVNGLFCQALGKTKENVLGKTDLDFFPAHLAAKYRSDDQRVIASGKPFEAEEEHRTHSGAKSYVHVIKTPLYDGGQLPVGLQVIFWDVTARREAEEARKKAEADLAYERDLLRTLMDNSPEVIYFKDLQSRFVRYSKSLVAMFHLESPEWLCGKTDFDVFAEEHARPAFEDEQEIIRTGRAMLAKVEKETHIDGRVSWALTSKLPWRDDSGKIVGTFGISQNITSMKEAEAKLELVHKQLVDASRQAGMAEVATSVLHNVGNVLNSVNVAATLMEERVKNSRVADLARLAGLLRDHETDLLDFLTADSKGGKVVGLIGQINEQLTREQSVLREELALLRNNVEHIKDIVAMQQSYARISGVVETVEITQLIEDALRINAAALARHQVEVLRHYSPLPPLSTEKHKVLQILVNLISNAKYACENSSRCDKKIILQAIDGRERVRIIVADNGVGIPPENLTRIFNLGFTTRKNGHGFGLHSGALAAQDIGGSLDVQSAGCGQGSVFTLELPRQPSFN